MKNSIKTMVKEISKKESKKISREEHVESITPMDPAMLAELDYECARIAHMIQEYADNVHVLSESALKIDVHEARQLGVALEVRDIVKSSNAIRQFLGIVSDLNENIHADLAVIYKRRKEFQYSIIRKLLVQEAEEKEAARKAAKAACEKERREKAKAEAGDPKPETPTPSDQ